MHTGRTGAFWDMQHCMLGHGNLGSAFLENVSLKCDMYIKWCKLCSAWPLCRRDVHAVSRGFMLCYGAMTSYC